MQTNLLDVSAQQRKKADLKFYLDTDHPVALDSPDHVQPRSTKLDNYTSVRFNKRLLDMFTLSPSILDFGCAGGGLVQSFIVDGCEAVGLEGSDYSLMHQRAAWSMIPDNLFTCDLGYPFTLHLGDGVPYRFDVITAWEFMEHIPEERVDIMIENMRAHLKPGGLVIGSVTDHDSLYDGVEHHPTRKPLWWWIERFAAHGFARSTHLEEHFRCAKAWVRESKWPFVFQEDAI